MRPLHAEEIAEETASGQDLTQRSTACWARRLASQSPIRLDADVSETIAAFLVGLTEDERRGLDSELHRVAMVRRTITAAIQA